MSVAILSHSCLSFILIISLIVIRLFVYSYISTRLQIYLYELDIYLYRYLCLFLNMFLNFDIFWPQRSNKKEGVCEAMIFARVIVLLLLLSLKY